MRVLLATYGSRGDVEPMVALAVQLRTMGAQVSVCAPPDEEFKNLLARFDVPLVTFSKTWRSRSEGSSTAEDQIFSVDDHVASYIAVTYDTLAVAAEGCDMLVASGMLHFTARSVAELLGIPHRFAVFCPTLLNAQPWHGLVVAPINAHRASIGLLPMDNVHEFMFTGRPWLAADPTLAPLQAKAGQAIDRTGAWLLEDERPLSTELMRFLDAGPPPVYLGFGSMRVLNKDARVAIEAIRAQGFRVLLASGWSGLTPMDDQDDCFVVGEVNQQALFCRVAAVVHHGGAGTTTTAARTGTPQIVIPQTADQPYWADRVAELGIGAAQDGPLPNLVSLSKALEIVLHPDTRARAAAMADAVRTDGSAAAAELVFDAISQKQPS
ncbi:glycosyltransferase family 1 protein [Mesorhizobium microcysteis]|uniref:Glycosyltransferase family 1 protein n=1 Tax=Neoaquamicrobium microcysteis TaxID=2682781 RepID=A0A5D4H6V8_9HYPH|nr:glycosyltransferase [Mesorhizobium microcysteis]TYR36781.1 glycosyltransferase family 1 protein [Mesorhizobium microcysteis]